MKKFLAALTAAVIVLVMMFSAVPVSAASAYKNAKPLKSGAKIDLNKDGKKDKVEYGSIISGDYDKEGSITFKINGKAFKVNSPKCTTFGSIYYGDIRKSDKYVDILACLDGEFSDSYCMILRYEGKKLKICSVQNYDYDTNKYKKATNTAPKHASGVPQTDGKGHVTFAETKYALGGCFIYRKSYTLNKKSYKMKEKAENEVKCDKTMVGTAARAFSAFKSKSLSAATFNIKEGQTVKVLSVFKDHWIKIKTDGRTGWLLDTPNDPATYPNDFFVQLKDLPAWS